MNAPRHPLAASELIRNALAAAAIPMKTSSTRPGTPMVSRVSISRKRDMDDARQALERMVTNAGDVDQVGPDTFEVTWP